MGKDPASFQDRVELGDQCQLSGDSIGAIIEYGAACEIRNDPKLHTKIADLYRVLGEEDKAAQEDIEAAASQKSGTPSSSAAVASKSEDQSALNAAVTRWSSVVTKDPLDPKNHIALGLAYRNRGDFNKAETEYKLALKFSPGHRNPVAERLLSELPAAKQASAMNRTTSDKISPEVLPDVERFESEKTSALANCHEPLCCSSEVSSRAGLALSAAYWPDYHKVEDYTFSLRSSHVTRYALCQQFAGTGSISG